MLRYLAGASSLTLLLTGAAHAASDANRPIGVSADIANAEPADTDESEPTTEDVVVNGKKTQQTGTATKLPLTLRETPQSVTVVDRQRIEDFNLNTIADVLAQTPGVTITSIDSNRANFNIRGFPVRNFQYDGVPTIYQVGAYTNSAVNDTTPYERIEIVRGAAGLLAGVGDPSATVNLVRKRAPDTFQGSYTMLMGSWSYHRFEGDVGGPVNRSGTVRARIAAAYTDRKSFVDFQHDLSPVVYATIEADVTPHTRLRVGADWVRTDSNGAGWGSTPLLFTDGTHVNLPRSWSGAARYNRWLRDNFTVFGSAEQDLGGSWIARVSYNRRRNETDSRLFNIASGFPRPDGTGLSVYNQFSGRTAQNENSYDGYVSGKFKLFGREHELVGGVNRYDRAFTVDYTATQVPVTGFPTVLPNIFTWDGRVPVLPVAYSDAPQWVEKTRETGVYGVLRLNPADWLKVIAGARYTDWSTRRDNYLRDGSANVSPATGLSYTRNSATKLIPYGGVVIDVTKAISLYASYASVFSPNSVRGVDGELLPPTSGANYEAGIKATPFGEGFTISAAGFHIKQNNLAVIIPGAPPLPDNSTPYQSVAGVSTWGGEAEVAGSPLPGWTVSGSYTYARSEDRTGTRILPQFPLHIARVYTTYRLPGDRLMIGGGVSGLSRIYVVAPLPTGRFQPTGAPVLATGEIGQKGGAEVDLLARYRLTDRASLGLNVTNLFDRKYLSTVTAGFGGAGGFYGEPRRIVGSIRVGF